MVSSIVSAFANTAVTSIIWNWEGKKDHHPCHLRENKAALLCRLNHFQIRCPPLICSDRPESYLAPLFSHERWQQHWSCFWSCTANSLDKSPYSIWDCGSCLYWGNRHFSGLFYGRVVVTAPLSKPQHKPGYYDVSTAYWWTSGSMSLLTYLAKFCPMDGLSAYGSLAAKCVLVCKFVCSLKSALW